MKSRIEQEWDGFKEKFQMYADKRIVLYGIGRGTATLVSENTCFNFVGLMDRDTQNIGKNMYGLPILSLTEAERTADMIIISAPETYWEIIYKRIKDCRIPVYYRNGEKAHISGKKVASIQEIIDKLQYLAVGNTMVMMVTNICDMLSKQQKPENNSSGPVEFGSFYAFGYCLWGPIVYTFCEWLYRKSKERNISQLLFPSRDGYFLQQDYDYFVEQNNLTDAAESMYLLTSRRIASVAAIETEEDYQEWVLFPFNGTFSEYMWSRFMINIDRGEINHADCRIQMPLDQIKVREWMMEYEDQIKDSIRRDRGNYKRYLSKIDLQDNFALVDVGYTGNIQRRLSRLLQRQLTGFYFVCDLSPENGCLKGNELIPCFQKENDYKADETAIYRKPQLLEAMFTAPYGMVMAVDEHSERICMPPSQNQAYFEERMEINRGIQSFIHDMGYLDADVKEMTEQRLMSDRIFGILLGNVGLGSEIEKIFYWEDAIVQTRENMIFQ